MQSIIIALEAGKNDQLVQSTMEVDGDDAMAAVDLEDQNQRTQSLADVLAALNQLWQQGSNGIVNAAEKLADACRNRKSYVCSITFLVHDGIVRSSSSHDLFISHSTVGF